MLGKTGLEVTELCFGALPFGPLQKNLPVDAAAEVLSTALAGGPACDERQLYIPPDDD